jgi:hypothetical protein
MIDEMEATSHSRARKTTEIQPEPNRVHFVQALRPQHGPTSATCQPATQTYYYQDDNEDDLATSPPFRETLPVYGHLAAKGVRMMNCRTAPPPPQKARLPASYFLNVAKINCEIFGLPVMAIVDSGASTTIMSQAVYRKLQARMQPQPLLEPTQTVFVTAGGNREKPWGVIRDVPITVGKLTIDMDVPVVPSTVYDLLLGSDWLAQAGYHMFWDSKKMRVMISPEEYDEVDFTVDAEMDAPCCMDRFTISPDYQEYPAPQYSDYKRRETIPAYMWAECPPENVKTKESQRAWLAEGDYSMQQQGREDGEPLPCWGLEEEPTTMQCQRTPSKVAQPKQTREGIAEDVTGLIVNHAPSTGDSYGDLPSLVSDDEEESDDEREEDNSESEVEKVPQPGQEATLSPQLPDEVVAWLKAIYQLDKAMRAETRKAPKPCTSSPPVPEEEIGLADVGQPEGPALMEAPDSPTPSLLMWQYDPGHPLLGSPDGSKSYPEEMPEPQFFSNDSEKVASESTSSPH